MGLESEGHCFIPNSCVHVTDRCNFSCPHCAQTRSNRDMSVQDFSYTLDWLQNRYLSGVTIFGGEVRIHPNLKQIVGEAKARGLDVTIYTNGFGMTNPGKAVDTINNLAEKGVDTLVISLDSEHKKFAQQMGVGVDYEFLGKLCRHPKDVKKEYGINENIEIDAAGNGYYVIPIGRAKGFSWEERLKGGWPGSHSQALMADVKDELNDEFTKWKNIRSYSHTCYCKPAKNVREYRSWKKGGSPGLLFWSPIINTDKTVTMCPFDLIPRIGSIENMSTESVFMKVNSNLLYNTIAYEGPQGVARMIWNIGEKELREIY